MVFRSNTGDNEYLFITDKEKVKYEQVEIDNLRRKKQNLDIDIANRLKRKHEAIERWEGHDVDRDLLDDGMEVQVGTHNEQNKPLHRPFKRFGPTTPGPAYVSRGGVQFDYDDSIISIGINPSHSVVGGVHKMKTPKKMVLSVPFGKEGKTHDASKFKLELDVHPEKFRMNDGKIKKVGIKKVSESIEKVAKKSVKKSLKNDSKKSVDDLSGRLTGFLQKQKKSENIKLTGGKNLDFSLVGITENPVKKKIRGFSL